MHETPDTPLTHDEERVDALGKPFVVGPSKAEAMELSHMVQRWGRFVGRVAMADGLGLDLVMGLLDGGLGVDEIMDALVMHGDLPDTSEIGDGTGRVRLIEAETGWDVEVA